MAILKSIIVLIVVVPQDEAHEAKEYLSENRNSLSYVLSLLLDILDSVGDSLLYVNLLFARHEGQVLCDDVTHYSESI